MLVHHTGIADLTWIIRILREPRRQIVSNSQLDWSCLLLSQLCAELIPLKMKSLEVAGTIFTLLPAGVSLRPPLALAYQATPLG